MFERYTEKARRVVFFARYEASQFGTAHIKAEHILLGLLREDEELVARFFRPYAATAESIRKEIEDRTILQARIATNINLPLSSEAKRVLAFAAEESALLGDRHLGTEHLLLGLLRQERSLAATILFQIGLRLAAVREELSNNRAADEALTEKQGIDPSEDHKKWIAPDQGAQKGRLFHPPDYHEKWMWELTEACIEEGLFTLEDLVGEFTRVAALRQFRADEEALLRLLAAKGLANSRNLPAFAFQLREEKRLAEFIEKLRETSKKDE